MKTSVQESDGQDENRKWRDARSSSEWPIPLPLTTKLVAEPYPVDALPPTVRAAVLEVHGFIKAPLALVASSALGALSVVVQACVDVKRHDQLIGPVGVFLLTIADSGERKTTADSFFNRVIKMHEQRRAADAKPVLANYRAAKCVWEAKQSGMKEKVRQLAKRGAPTIALENELRELEGQKPKEPRVQKIFRVDDTPESLAWGLMHDRPAAGVVSSEAGLVFGGYGMNRESLMRYLGLFNRL